MATVLIQHGEQGPDGGPPPRAYFQLIEGKLHMPTIRDYFRLANIALDGVVYPTDQDGFTFSTFSPTAPNTSVRVTGDPLPGANTRLTRILLIRTNEVYGEADQPGSKRKVMQAEENLGLWTLPPPEQQPRTLTDLTNALRSFLQIEHSITWIFKYRYFSELVPIVSDSAMAEAFDHFRAMSNQYADDDAALGQHCRLYLNTTSEEIAPRDRIRARITGILDAAAATSSGRDSAAAAAASILPPPLPGPTLPLAVNDAAAMALLSNQLAAAGYPFSLALQQQAADAAQQDGGVMYGGGGGEGDGDDGDDVDQGDGGTMSGLLGYQRQSGSEGAGGGGGGGSAANQAALKKESKTRHADGRFKNEVQHQRKMADMARKITELFDGAIIGMVEVHDHKKIMCLVCNHACTAYSAYHTDCVRKHFLRHHESTLRERNVDVARWRKEYEVSQKVKRQQQLQQHDQPMLPGMPGGLPGVALSLGPQGQITLPAGVLLNSLNGFNGINGLGALGAINGIGIGEGEGQQRGSLQTHLLSIAGFPVDLSLGLPVLAQSFSGAVSGAAAGSGAGGAASNPVSALLQQAAAVSQDEHVQLQAAGALSSLMTAASTASVNNGTAPGPGAQSLATQLSGALGGNNSGGGAPVAMAPMARMASGTVTTEMPLPPPPLPAQGDGNDSLLHEVNNLVMTRSASVHSQGPGALPSMRSPPVVTTDMSQPSA